MKVQKRSFSPYYANDNSALIPEQWAAESLLILEEEMVMGGLVHRDFEHIVANYGETVHTRKPNEFIARRKTDADEVQDQAASATNVPVVLNQWVHVAFIIKDGERSKAFKDLVQFYLHPAMLANARILDRSLAGQSVQFLSNVRGGLGMLTKDTAHEYYVGTRDMFNQNKVFMQGRNLVLGSSSEAKMLETDLFIHADKVGDGGRALREAELGRKFGFQNYMDINIPQNSSGTKSSPTTLDGAIDAGATTMTLAADNVAVGQYFTVVGDMTPLRCQTRDANTAEIITATTRPTLRSALHEAVVQPYATGTVSASRANGYVKEIRVGGTGVPHVGQLVAFTNQTGPAIYTPEYTIVHVDSLGGGAYDILLDRPLENALAENDIVNYGPDGEYNFAFHRNAVALVNRPLALPMSNLATAAVAEYNNMSVRVTITYDGKAQGHRVVVDGLFGVAVLDNALGGVLLG